MLLPSDQWEYVFLTSVTCCAGVIQAWGLGWVGLGVRTDVASASGSLRRLVFRIWDFSHRQRARHEEQWREGQRGRKLRVRSGQDFTAMIFDNQANFTSGFYGAFYTIWWSIGQVGKPARTSRGHTFHDVLARVMRRRATGGGHVMRRDAEHVCNEMSGIGPG